MIYNNAIRSTCISKGVFKGGSGGSNPPPPPKFSDFF